MMIVLAMLLALNLAASWRLRHEICFDFEDEPVIEEGLTVIG